MRRMIYMETRVILSKSLKQWINEFPLLDELIETNEIVWLNPKYGKFKEAVDNISISEMDVKDAEERLKKFAPYIEKAFPETRNNKGIIESPLIRIPEMKISMEKIFKKKLTGDLLIKCDNDLPVSGSIKARGGIYEILKHAEELAIQNNMLTREDDYSKLDSEKFKSFFSNYSIVVGSTGNLGLSIGIISAKLGFKATVHMSDEAKQWKKALLRSQGVNVIEYKADYSKAVEEGRKQSQLDLNSYFVDDENSKDLFLGYAVAAFRVKKQLEELNIIVDDNHPLIVYLPCGVGGGPGGVAYGLKLVYEDNVHIFLAEPTHSPCMLLGIMTGMHNSISVQDFGIDNKTAADGLAVGRASKFVGQTIENFLSGIYTVEDKSLFLLLSELADSENIYLEPSALAGMPGVINLLKTKEGLDYIYKNKLEDKMENAAHIVWATGGSMVPRDEMKNYYNRGVSLR
jgi:D-serine dehydratase